MPVTTDATTALNTMKTKAPILVGAILLLAGALIFMNRDPGPLTEDKKTLSGKSGFSTIRTLAPEGSAAHTAKPKPREPAKNSELVAKYGESRTNLSKFVANNVVSLFEDGVEMGEMAASGQIGNAFGGSRGGLGRSLGAIEGKLNLNEEQRAKAAALVAEYQKREITRSKETIDRLKKDPTSLMKLMLVSDSYKRGEITEDQFNQERLASGDELKGVFNPLNRDNLRGQPLKEEQFRRDFAAMLDPSQAETYQSGLAELQTRETTEGDRSDISNMPPMELEKLDQTITSAKKLTTGLKSMMEGMGDLQELGPLLEQQRRQPGRTPNPAE